jgi:putative FmdB family regulatory protein
MVPRLRHIDMPLYEYECEACKHRFERIQKFSDPQVDTCPVCAGKVRKLLSSPAFQFKGTGWYVTDYAKKSGSGSGESSTKSSDGEKSSDGSTKSEKSGESGKDTAAPAATTTTTKTE